MKEEINWDEWCSDCTCFKCEDDCSVCWAGPMCDFDDTCPCMNRSELHP